MRSPARVPSPANRRPASESRDRSRTNRVVRDRRQHAERERVCLTRPGPVQAEDGVLGEQRNSHAQTIAPKSDSHAGTEGWTWSRLGPQEITCREGRCRFTADLTKSVAS